MPSFQTSQPYGAGEIEVGVPRSRIQQFSTSEHGGVRAGGAILQQNPDVFPVSRGCRDVLWSLIFIVLFAGLAAVACTDAKRWNLNESDVDHDAKKVGAKTLAVSVSSSVALACLLSFVFLFFAKHCAKLVVWTSLLFTPTVMLLIAASFIFFPKFWKLHDDDSKDDVVVSGKSVSQENLIAAACLAIPALLLFLCYCICWRRLIDFTAKNLSAVATIFAQHFSLGFVALICLVCSVVWTILCGLAVLAGTDWLKQNDKPDCASKHSGQQCDNSNSIYGVYCLVVFVFLWGATVFHNVSHTTNCGVFGQWYFHRTVSVRSSLWASLTTSFGSICFGSLIVAFLSAVEATLRMMRKNNEGNAAVRVLVCVIECMVACIRDIVEAFSDFAYVQVALRGLSFWSSAKVTFALCKWENLFAFVATTLVSNVCALGALMCGLVAGGAGYVIGVRCVPLEGLSQDDLNTINAVTITSAIVVGLVTARTILNVLRSGFITMVVCWAENKEALRTLQYGLYEEYSQRHTSLL